MSLQKQLLSSHDDEDQQSSDGAAASGGEDKEDTNDDEDEEDDGEIDQDQDDDDDKEVDTAMVEEDATEETSVDIQEPQVPFVYTPVKVMYQNRDILDLSNNLVGSGKFVQNTVLPDNNVKYYFENRAQYWRLSGEKPTVEGDMIGQCPCCDFTYPSTQKPMKDTKCANAFSDSLVMFLKTMEQVYNTTPAPPIATTPNVATVNNNSTINNNFYGNNKRSSNISQIAYQMQQQAYHQQQQQPTAYQPPQQQSYNSSNNNNNFNQAMNPLMNNSTMALLSLMNNATNNAANAFRAMNNTQRYYNNQSNLGGGFGLYKQF